MSYTYRLTQGTATRLPHMTSHMREASGDDLRVLMALAISGYSATVEELAKATGCSLSRAAASLEYWLDAGILVGEETKHLVSDDLPKGGSADNAREIKEHELRPCLETCAAILDKLLNPSEIGVLVAIIRELGVEEAYLVTLLDYCVNKLDKRGVRYLEKVAVNLCDRGIHTLPALEEYIRRQDAVHSMEGKIRKMWGMGERALTEKEREILDRWINTYQYPMDVIAIAYDLTVNRADKVTLRYTDKILASWYQMGLCTVSEIDAYLAEEASNRAPAPKKKPASKAASFDVGSFFEDALKRSYNTDTKDT